MKRINRLYLNFLVCTGLIPAFLAAQDNPDFWQGDTLIIGEVTILHQRNIAETGISKSEIDSLVLEKKALRSLSEVLAEHSPVFIKSYGRGTLATASFRGTAPSHTKVNWNGMEINSPMLGMTDFSLIPVYFADDITLFHGTGSMRETGGALGGLISLNTKPDPGKKYSGSFVQGIGSFGSLDNLLKINIGEKQFHSGTRIFYSHSDNDFTFINRDIIDSVDMETGEKFHPVQKNKNAGYSQYGILQELYYRPGSRDMLKLSIWKQKSDRFIPGLTADESGSDGGKGQQADDILRLIAAWKHYGEKMQVEYLSGVNVQDLSYLFSSDVSGLGLLELVNSDASSISFSNRAEVSYNRDQSNVFHSRISWTADRVKSNEAVSMTGYDEHRHRTSFLISWNRQWGEKVRSAVSIGEEMSGNEWSPVLYNLSAEYHLLDNDRFYLQGGIARNVKFPGLNDLFFQPGGNPLLKNETGINKEIGLKRKIILPQVQYNFSMIFYHTGVNDWILWLPTFKGYWEPRNIERVEISGVECSVALSGTAGSVSYRVRTDYAFSSSKNQSGATGSADMSVGKQLPFIPLHSANILADVSGKGWSLTWLWNYFSERFVNSSNDYYSSRDYLYPYFMNQLSAGKNFIISRCRADISLNINNLFNEEYRSVLQRPMPGRNYTLMLKISL